MEPIAPSLPPAQANAASPWRCACVIPTYNNAATLPQVILNVKSYCEAIIVVDDGSTDTTKQVLEGISGVIKLGYGINKGKGHALRIGMHHALHAGFTHAITIDADGQHRSLDIPVLLKESEQFPRSVVMGSRSLDAPGSSTPPLRSRVGRSFGAFWFTFITGQHLFDTQSGFRVYPLAAVVDNGCVTDRYEYEQEILIAVCWQGFGIRSVAVQRHYFVQETRTSHFRPWMDFFRIFAVNSRAAFQRCLLPKQLWTMRKEPFGAVVRRALVHELKANASPRKASISLSLGTFFGILPIYGFQVLSLVGLSFVLPLNRPLAFLGVSISSAPLLPIWIGLGVMIGLPFTKLVEPYLPATTAFHYGAAWFIGSTLLACGIGLVTAGISYPLFAMWQKKKKYLSV